MRRNFYILILAGILIVVLFNLPDSTTARMNNFLRDATFPLARPMARLLASGRSLFQDEPQAANQTQLLTEIAQLRMELRQAQVLERENHALRQMLGLSAHVGRRLIAAEIIARDVNAWWQTARLNKGLADGIALDMAVITPEGLAGHIIRISRTTSDVLFLVDPACRISARLTRLDAFGIVRGQGVSWRGQASCRMDFISKAAQIMPGDEVVTSGLGGVYPSELVIGHVKKVRLDPSGLYQSADIVPTSDFRSLDLMFVISRNESGRQPAHRSFSAGGTVDPPSPERFGGQATDDRSLTSSDERRTKNEEPKTKN
ncbi:MAG: rod shape-determining protein MreC [Verrucomicrobia bacterium]|nr:rod shape-determining protein MreC [Verrucomicrobiota bacterium]MBU1736326.1 rod shape-determining protein MreC [Verrucomicrobiota bacterium]MBU1857371.1 rod shape-determining protein MreC [Verrucomicrobiota bacterium]